MYTIGQIANRFSLSRSTLLYYDSIGLLTPTGRSDGNYRLYSDADVSRMERISVFREAGLPLKAIARLLKSGGNEANAILEAHLLRINEEIQGLRRQQSVVLQMLQNEEMSKRSRIISKEQWVSLLRATGLSEEAMEKWHIEFEKMTPEAHQDFLEALGMPEEEISTIRSASRNAFERK